MPINPRQAAAPETVKGLLMELGMEVGDFDSGSVTAVHSFPSLLGRRFPPREFCRTCWIN